MFVYIKKYIPYLIVAALFMLLEVTMDLLQPHLMRFIVDDGVLGLTTNANGDFSLIIKIGFLMVLFALIGCLGGSLNNVLVNYSSQNIGNLIRKEAFSKVLSFSFSQIDKIGTGALITRITNDITQVENFISIFVRGMIRTGFLLIGSLCCMFLINSHFGFIALAIIPVIFVCIFFAIKKVEPIFLSVQESIDKINSILQEDISGIRIIKAYLKELYEKIRFGKANDELLAKQLKILILFAFLHPVANTFMYLGIAFMIWDGGKAVETGISTPGSIMAAITYTTQLLHSVLMVVFIIQSISRGTTSWKRVNELLTTTSELKEVQYESNNSQTTQENIAVEFKNASFAYSKDDNPIIKNINLKIKKGETIGIMGATGCGKTTLVSLIPRFYDVDSGQILIDGIDVKDYPLKDLRNKISFVLQKSELFTETIADNIRWGNPNSNIEEIKEVAKIAQADTFIENIPNNYENIVAERGMSLSGGQRQRISLARAVIKEAEILILDDSTSALDLKTEKNFYTALNNSKSNITKIIIAQRIASIRNADKIAILENGTISAYGNHNELINNCDIYKEIYNSQIGDEVKNG